MFLNNPNKYIFNNKIITLSSENSLKIFFLSRDRLKVPKNKFLYFWFVIRFETFIPFYLKNYWYHIIIFRLKKFIPSGKNFLKKSLIHILFKFFTNSYKGYRHFLCLPVNGNRTWSNHKSQKKKPKYFLEFYKLYYFRKYKNYCSNHRKNYILYIEFLNRVWFFHFFIDYLSAKKARLKYSYKSKYVTWKFDLKNAIANRLWNHIEKKEKINKRKKKKNRKKIKIKNNLFNVGFDFFFTKNLQKKIFSSFYVKAQKTKTKKKKKKKK